MQNNFWEKNDLFWVFINMKKIVRLTESELIKIIRGVIKEVRDIDILDDLKQYMDSECVTVKYIGGYVVVDVESPSYFGWNGFDKDTGLRIKSKLRKNGFMSTGVGQYIKKLN